MNNQDRDDNNTCTGIRYRQLYEEYNNSSFFGNFDELAEFLRPRGVAERNREVDTGYRPNKNTADVIYWDALHSKLHWKIYDHIRVIEETLAGMIHTEDKEFKLILRRFMSYFLMSDVWVVYSEEVKNLELSIIKSISESEGTDSLERIEKACPDCNYRLLKRINDNGTYKWDALLSNCYNVKLPNLPHIRPVRFSFNEGFMFLRLYHIFLDYEARLQIYNRAFTTLHKAVTVTGESPTTIQESTEQNLLSGHVHIEKTLDDTTIYSPTELIKDVPMLTESYHNIVQVLNDALNRLGIGGDDSTKAERITTGENFRALQPSMLFQNSIMLEMENITHLLKLRFNRDIQFINKIGVNQQGIPTNPILDKDQPDPMSTALNASKKGQTGTWSK